MNPDFSDILSALSAEGAEFSIDGMDFGNAWSARLETDLGGLTVPVLSREHLIQNKRATGRPQDLADAARLEDRGRGTP